jgi:hypothetical protein
MEFNKWTFTGRAEFFNRDTGCMDELSVTRPMHIKGRSEAEALNRVKFNIRKNKNLPMNTRIALFDYMLEIVPDKNDFETHEQIKKCDQCGTLLTDAGECPKCDLLDDRYDESFILDDEDFIISDIKPTKNDQVTNGTFDAMEHSYYALAHMFKDLTLPGVEIKNFSNTGFTVNSTLIDFDNTLIKVRKYSAHSDWILIDIFADSGYIPFIVVFETEDLKQAARVCPSRLIVQYIKIMNSIIEFVCNNGSVYKFDLNAVLEDLLKDLV